MVFHPVSAFQFQVIITIDGVTEMTHEVWYHELLVMRGVRLEPKIILIDYNMENNHSMKDVHIVEWC